MNYDTLLFWLLLILWGAFFLAFWKKSRPSDFKTKDITIDAMVPVSLVSKRRAR